MVRHITTLQALGQDTVWLLLKQARGIPDAKAVDDFMTDRGDLIEIDRREPL